MKDRDVVLIFADAAVKPTMTGIGLAIKDGQGRLIAWRGKRAPAMTSVEAEYAAIVFALDYALERAAQCEVHILSDSRIAIEQIQGEIGVHKEALRQMQRKARALAARLPRVRFIHIPRERNELADAMAEDVCQVPRPLIT